MNGKDKDMNSLGELPHGEHPATEHLTIMSEAFEVVDAAMCYPADPFYYRILTKASSKFKYLIAPSAPRGVTAPDIYGAYLAFRSVPVGNWYVGHLKQSTAGDRIVLELESVAKGRLPDLGREWHPLKVDISELAKPIAMLGMGNGLQGGGHLKAGLYHPPPCVATGRPVVVVWNWDAEAGLGVGNDSDMFALIEGRGIGPKFLAHVTENGNRRVGFMVEKVDGRIAGPQDLAKCQKVLSRLHSLGIAHGVLRRDSFIVIDRPGIALLHCFATAYKASSQSTLNKEMASLETILSEPIECYEPCPWKEKL
jgi:hypothetical protein